jgi:hypothetical protein
MVRTEWGAAGARMEIVIESFDAERMIECAQTAARTPLSTPPGMRDALVLGYHLSLEQEEARPLRFTFALAPSSGHSLPFEQRLQAPVQGYDPIRRLCLAADPERACLRLELSAKRLAVVAFAERPDRHEWTSVGGATALIEVDAPGTLTLVIGTVKVRFERHRYVTPTPANAILEVLPEAVVRSVTDYCATPAEYGPGLRSGEGVLIASAERLEQHRDKIRAEGERLVEEVVPEAVHDLLRATIEHRHGAICLIVGKPELILPDDLPPSVFESAHVLSPSPAGGRASAPWTTGMLDYVAWALRRRLAARGISLAQEALDDFFKGHAGTGTWIQLVADPALNAARVRWREQTAVCARLAQVDGAVVFDAMLQPRMFGAKIAVPVDSLAGLPDDVREKVAPRGMRHRSAAVAVSRLPDSCAFVVSQDGGVTAFRRSADAGMEVHSLTL